MALESKGSTLVKGNKTLSLCYPKNSRNLRYIGEYVADLQEGSGTAYYSSGAMKYVGEWRKGSPHGNGTYIALNGDRCELQMVK